MTDRSGTIRVIKRDGTVEVFDRAKLAGAMWRCMSASGTPFSYTNELAGAIQVFLLQRPGRCASSSAIFEMLLKALRYVGLATSADEAELYHRRRDVLRRQLRIRHDSGAVTLWSKRWLCEFAERSWGISPVTARIMAGQVEMTLLRQGWETVDRTDVLELLNTNMSAYGLADAVPIKQ